MLKQYALMIHQGTSDESVYKILDFIYQCGPMRLRPHSTQWVFSRQQAVGEREKGGLYIDVNPTHLIDRGTVLFQKAEGTEILISMAWSVILRLGVCQILSDSRVKQ